MVKKGYKQTEIGVIPEDWEIKYLSDFGKIQSGGTPSTTMAEYWGATSHGVRRQILQALLQNISMLQREPLLMRD